MKVLYYTDICFLDIAIEVINILKNDVDLHVLIELAPDSLDAKLNKNNLVVNKTLISPFEFLNEDSYNYLEPYFNGCASINFIMYKHKASFFPSTIKIWINVWQYIRKIKPKIICLEEISLRQLVLIPFLLSGIKFNMIIHDAKPHSGEKNWKAILPRFLFLDLPFSKKYFFYSHFSKIQFEQHYRKDKNKKYVMRMYPYTYYKKYAKEEFIYRKHILFFGRVSAYKGIDVLLKAMPLVFKEFASELLIIAGRSIPGFNLNADIPDEHKSQITILNRYIPNEELVPLIQESKFIVCPYLDASQSGVLMTAFALNTPVIATNVGAFPEYIEQNVTGILVPVNDPNKLAEAIMSALNNNFYKTMGENVSIRNNTNLWSNNRTIILNAFFS